MKNVLSNKILAWYDNHQRDLPWRRYRGFKDRIYKVLVSEFMLQQTQVKTVIPFFNKFIKVFPNLKKLSKANLEKVYKLWQGLGYYSRAKNLLNTAKIVQSEYEGILPADYEILKSFPGIGEYTASAIMAIAFDEDFIGIDGNVERFVARLFGYKNNKKNFKKIIFLKLKEIKPKNNFSQFAQALMEMGALVCAPQNPRCNICPVQRNCISFKKKNFNYKIFNKKKINIKKYYLLYASKRNKILFFNSKNKLLQDFVNLPLVDYKKNLFDMNFKKNIFQFEGKPKITKKYYVHNISNIKMLIKIVLFKKIKKINDNKFYWINYDRIDNSLLSNFSKKFIELVKTKKIKYV
ncbi:MAG: A/G-specific adenine glycosylase [Candidatus Fonsibacter lacus]